MNAPIKDRITQADIEALIISEQYHVFPGTTVTICCLGMKNGYQATGESACVVAANFIKATGEKYAKEQAIETMWRLAGYLLKQLHHEAMLASVVGTSQAS